MLCSGNTMIMCGTCDMGRKKFFLGLIPPPPGVPPKKYPTRYQNFFPSIPPGSGSSSVCSIVSPRRRKWTPWATNSFSPIAAVLLPATVRVIEGCSSFTLHCQTMDTPQPWCQDMAPAPQ